MLIRTLRISAVCLLLGTGLLPAASHAESREVMDASLSQTARDLYAAGAATWAQRESTTGETMVEVNKTDASGNWMLGSVTPVLKSTAHEAPNAVFFLAHRVDGVWLVGMEGSLRFRELATAAPPDLLDSQEKQNFTRQPNDLEAMVPTGLALPWREGVAWYMGGGPHGNSGNSRPFNSIDFNGRDGRVLAPRAGKFYRSCVRGGSALIKLVHDNGLSTTYYHMVNLANYSDGTQISKGTYLGTINIQLPCGGFASGPHVHFSLLRNNAPLSVNNQTIGGWTFYEGSQAYRGYALRNGQRVNPGGSLVNYGTSLMLD
ncbi:M23 family metallopeptidase [Chitinivorax sp. B]|uniref:M23 family metallopeptidase n=1 Tax=Chitinivorax sp. B TaxID=2502235 RepID=UPI0010F71FCB|nr:M23 family metallopeptidase [Chitinivorax sp. B]